MRLIVASPHEKSHWLLPPPTEDITKGIKSLNPDHALQFISTAALGFILTRLFSTTNLQSPVINSYVPTNSAIAEYAAVYLEMPVAFMDSFDQGSPFSQSDSQSPQDWGTELGDHKHERKEKNRDAARKSRKKQTEKADVLHEELQTLERSNAAYVKEIADLKKELQIYTTALEQHEPHCFKLCPREPSVPITFQGGPSTFTPPSSDFTFIPDPNPLPLPLECLTDSPHNSNEISLTELIDSSNFSLWDNVNPNDYLQQF